MTDEESNKRQKRPLLNCDWEFKQEAQLKRHQNTKGSILIKHGNTQFAQMNRSRFIKDWTTMADNTKTPIYEVVSGSGQVRFYGDFEMVVECSSVNEKEWLLELTKTIKSIFIKNGVSESHANAIRVIRDTRDHEDIDDSKCTRLSFHLVWPEIFFEDNDQEMQSFVNEKIKPELEKKRKFLWIAQQKKGPVTKTAIDPSVYCKNKAFRVCFAPKKTDANSYLKPWNVEEWKEIQFENDEACQAYFESTLIGGGETNGCHVVPRTVAQNPNNNNTTQNIKNIEAHDEKKEKKQDRHQSEEHRKLAKD